jgi:hypothetical protein
LDAAHPRVVIEKLERFAWFVTAALLAGVWLFFEALVGYEIPTRAHPILGTLVASALVQGGIDLRRMLRWRSVLSGTLPPAEVRELAARAASLEQEDPELVEAIRSRRRKGAKP